MTIDLTPYAKKLTLPTSFVAPREPHVDDVVARAITRDDVTC